MITGAMLTSHFLDTSSIGANETTLKRNTIDFSNLAQKGRTKEDIQNAAKDFEAVFLTQMFQHMFDGVGADPIFGGGHAEETFKAFLYDEYGKLVSKAGGIGIASHVMKELLETQQITI